MSEQAQMQIMLPERATLQLASAEIVTILGALSEGPHKTVSPIIRTIEQQLLSQQIRPNLNQEAAKAIAAAANDVPVEVPAAPAVEEVAHHPV